MPESILDTMAPGIRSALTEMASSLVELCGDARNSDELAQIRSCVSELDKNERAALVEIFRTAALLVELVDIATVTSSPAPKTN